MNKITDQNRMTSNWWAVYVNESKFIEVAVWPPCTAEELRVLNPDAKSFSPLPSPAEKIMCKLSAEELLLTLRRCGFIVCINEHGRLKLQDSKWIDDDLRIQILDNKFELMNILKKEISTF